MSPNTNRFALKLAQRDKEALRKIATKEGETMAVVVRRLIREAARKRGLLPSEANGGEPNEGVGDGSSS
jgi:hypothetical protein